MEEKTIWTGIGIGLLALLVGTPLAFAYMGGNYAYGYGPPGYGMMGNWRAAPQAYAASGQPSDAIAVAPSENGQEGDWFDSRMVQMHNWMFGTNYTEAEFEQQRGRVGCH